MEYLPVGESLYTVQLGQRLTLFYSHNTLNPHYLILGDTASAADFLAEAQAEYIGKLADERGFQVEAAVWLI